ncbi:MAG TPA: SH3 domain-containing protein, partial [Methylophilaceae bacterium]|nr:SH3 domain-containing protein [Methylophilaceae bacterium]
QGGWMRVKAEAGEGWLKMTSIRLGVAVAAKGDSGLGSLAKMALTGRSGNTGVTATTGVRGLSPEELKNATPNPEAVKQLDQYASSKTKTQAFASAGKLQAQSVEYLDTVVAGKEGQ